MWLIVFLSWFFILYPKIAAMININFTHPMLIANFFPFLLCPVELNRPLHRITYSTSPLDSPFTDDCMLFIFTWRALDTLIRGITDHQPMEKYADPFIGEAWPQWVSVFNHESSLSTPNGRPVRAWRLWRASGKPWEGRLQPGRQGVDGQKGVKFQQILEEYLKQPSLGG